MRQLLEGGTVPSRLAAAWRVVDRAYDMGNTQPESKVKRLVRTYPFDV
jgi:hypothetical protein